MHNLLLLSSCQGELLRVFLVASSPSTLQFSLFPAQEALAQHSPAVLLSHEGHSNRPLICCEEQEVHPAVWSQKALPRAALCSTLEQQLGSAGLWERMSQKRLRPSP